MGLLITTSGSNNASGSDPVEAQNELLLDQINGEDIDADYELIADQINGEII